jgi:hypothetical protein
MLIEDPSSGYKAKVTSKGELVTQAITVTELSWATECGLAYSWWSGERDIAANVAMLLVKNTGDPDLIIDRAIINGSNVVCQWNINIGNATTTPSGTAVSGVNRNRKYASRIPDVLAYYNETAVAAGDTIAMVRTPVASTATSLSTVVLDLHGLRLPKNSYIQIIQVTESTSGSASVVGHFDPYTS